MTLEPMYATFEGTAFRGFTATEVEGLENIRLTPSQSKRVETTRIVHGYKPDTFECWALKNGPSAVKIVK